MCQEQFFSILQNVHCYCIIIMSYFRLLELVKLYETRWLARYLEHGAKYSIAGLQATVKQLIPDAEERIQAEANDS